MGLQRAEHDWEANTNDLLLTWWHLQRTYFQIKSHSLQAKTSTYFRGASVAQVPLFIHSRIKHLCCLLTPRAAAPHNRMEVGWEVGRGSIQNRKAGQNSTAGRGWRGSGGQDSGVSEATDWDQEILWILGNTWPEHRKEKGASISVRFPERASERRPIMHGTMITFSYIQCQST